VKRPVQTEKTGLFPVHPNLEIRVDRGPDRGLGPNRFTEFSVLISLGPVRSRSLAGPRTEPVNTSKGDP
jgi:hypothetical protein